MNDSIEDVTKLIVASCISIEGKNITLKEAESVVSFADNYSQRQTAYICLQFNTDNEVFNQKHAIYNRNRLNLALMAGYQAMMVCTETEPIYALPRSDWMQIFQTENLTLFISVPESCIYRST
ncbi:MAG: hypothetical protein F6K24_13410 [Okeania sp. SIO2D1]|nr:hypothetical protein [Okeania sp. SIO2D1]